MSKTMPTSKKVDVDPALVGKAELGVERRENLGKDWKFTVGGSLADTRLYSTQGRYNTNIITPGMSTTIENSKNKIYGNLGVDIVHNTVPASDVSIASQARPKGALGYEHEFADSTRVGVECGQYQEYDETLRLACTGKIHGTFK